MRKLVATLAFGMFYILPVLLPAPAGAAGEEMAVVAQIKGSDQNQPDSGEVQQVEQIVVTATGTEVPAKETSVAATTVTSQQIEARQATRVEQLLRDVPGVIASQTGGVGATTSILMRGGNSNMTQVLLNGFRLNDVGGFFDFSKLTTDNVDRVEVVRGPMSSLYGNDAMTGVINVIARRGEGPPSLSLITNWGGRAEGHNPRNLISEQRVTFQGSWEKFGYSVAYGNYYDYGVLPFNNRYTGNVLNSRLDFSPVDTFNLTLTTLFIDTYFGFPTSSGDRFDNRVFGGPGLDPDQNTTNNNLLLGLTANYKPWDRWEHELSLGYLNLNSRYNNKANPDQVRFQDYDYFSRDLEDQYSLNYRSNFILGDKDRVGSVTSVGLEARNERWKGWSHDVDWNLWPPPYVDNFTKASRGSFSYYLQEQLSLYNRFFLTVGGRLEDNSCFPKLEFTPRASAALRFPETNTTIRGAGGKGIKAPSFVETNSLNPFFLGNPALKPEQNISWEVGVDQWLCKDKVQGGLTYFENNFTDLIQYIQTGWTTGTYVNIAAAKTRGFELYLTAKPLDGLTVRTAYTYLTYLKVTDDGGITSINIITGQNLLRRPRQTWSFDLNYVCKPFEINFNGLYVGARFDRRPDNNAPYYALRLTNGGYFIANLAAYYTVVDNWGYVKRLQLMARANNLFDKNYNEVFGYSSPRFNIIGGLRLEM